MGFDGRSFRLSSGFFSFFLSFFLSLSLSLMYIACFWALGFENGLELQACVASLDCTIDVNGEIASLDARGWSRAADGVAWPGWGGARVAVALGYLYIYIF